MCFSCECTMAWNLVSLKLAVQFTCITLYELHSYYTRLEPVFLKFSVECTHAWSLCFLKACCIVHLMWNAHTVSSHSCYTCLDPIVLEVCVTMAWSRILPWAFIAWLQVAEVDLQVDFSERQFLSIGLVSQSLAICKLRSERQKVCLFLLAWNLFST